jgi:predicted RNA binding protein YcfA (HicA-like mRNA interferase family)
MFTLALLSLRRLEWRLVKVRDVIRRVESDGWRHVRTTGSHRHYKHALKPTIVTIPEHLGDELPKGTLKSIFKAAGLEAK